MRDSSVQHLKTVLLLGVVVNHAWAASQYIVTPQFPPKEVVSWFSNVLIVSGLPVFFFLSGYFAGKRSGACISMRGYWRLLCSKLNSLAVPYILWNLLFIVGFLSVAGLFPRVGERVASFRLGTLFGFVNKLLGLTERPIDAPLWFIRDLFMIFCALPLLVWLVKYTRWLLACLLIVLMIVPNAVYSHWYSIVCFTIGLYLSERKFNLHWFERCRWPAIGVWFLVSIVIFWALDHYHLRELDSRIMIWFYLLSVIAWMGMLRWTNFRRGGLFDRFLTPLSFYMYASHFLFCSMCLHMIAPWIPDSPFKLLILYGVFIVMGGGVILLTYLVGKRLCPRVLALLSGGRVS